MPPSIAIATPVLGGPGTMRVVLNSSSSRASGLPGAERSAATGGARYGGASARLCARLPLSRHRGAGAGGATGGACETGHTITHRGDDTAARARARCRGSCCCEQRADRYYRFTLEGEAAPPPLEPPPTNGLCNSRLCVGHASVHSDSGSRAWGSGGCARVLNSSSSTYTRPRLRPLR